MDVLKGDALKTSSVNTVYLYKKKLVGENTDVYGFSSGVIKKVTSRIKKTGLVLVDIKAEWCSPCKVIEPIIGEISTDYFGKLSVGKLDADTARELTVKLGIRNIPTILIYKDGEIVEKSVGSTTKEKLTSLIESQLS